MITIYLDVAINLQKKVGAWAAIIKDQQENEHRAMGCLIDKHCNANLELLALKEILSSLPNNISIKIETSSNYVASPFITGRIKNYGKDESVESSYIWEDLKSERTKKKLLFDLVDKKNPSVQMKRATILANEILKKTLLKVEKERKLNGENAELDLDMCIVPHIEVVREVVEKPKQPQKKGKSSKSKSKKAGFYAVAKGRNTGIYRKWSDCLAQVNKYPSAIFKKFNTLEEAEQYMNYMSKK